MSDAIQTLRNMAASCWAEVYEHREFLESVANKLAFLEGACIGMREENDSLQAQLADAEKKRETYALQVCLLLDTMQAAGTHVEANWCWCQPTVESHAALKEDKPLQPMETCPECHVYSEGGRFHRQVPPCSRLAAIAPAKDYDEATIKAREQP